MFLNVLIVVKVVVFCCFCLILWIFILRLLVEMGQFGNGSLISLRRGLPSGHWALLGMMFPCSQGTPPFPRDSEEEGQAMNPLEGRGIRVGEDGLSPKSLTASCSAVHWVCMFLCTTDSERLDFFNQVLSHPCNSWFLSEALCFAWEQAKVEREK